MAIPTLRYSVFGSICNTVNELHFYFCHWIRYKFEKKLTLKLEDDLVNLRHMQYKLFFILHDRQYSVDFIVQFLWITSLFVMLLLSNISRVYFVFYYMSGARGVMFIVVGNGHGDTSSIPGRD